MARREEDFLSDRPAFYDSWGAYWETIKRREQGGRATPDHGAYLPDPDEVNKRIKDVRYLRNCGFNEKFICSVMQYETPTIQVVRATIARVGVIRTWRKFRNFLADTEYDKEYGDDD